jgi:hypothetical protein
MYIQLRLVRVARIQKNDAKKSVYEVDFSALRKSLYGSDS